MFSKLKIENVGALLYNFPRTYTEYPKVSTGLRDINRDEKVALMGKLLKRPVLKRMRNITIVNATLCLSDGNVDLVWFNQPYIANQLGEGGTFVYYGTLTGNKMEHPIIFNPSKYENMIGIPLPVYPLTKDLKNSHVVNAVSYALGEIDNDEISEYIPDCFLKENSLMGEHDALLKIHFPDNYDDLKNARRRLVFDEFFDFFMKINSAKTEEENRPNNFRFEKTDVFYSCIKKLPFELTKGQLQTLEDIKKDLFGSVITQRMVEADVGSGKTVLALLSMVICAENGYKSAIMAPTEVLATQHYNTFLKFKETFGYDYPVFLLTGKMTAKEKKEVKSALKEPGPAFVIGTHALIQSGVTINDLALTVVDEQHRFGVKQRKDLSDKGDTPFSLVMTATPIPRSLAMILYGDMNISVIKDVPSKRLPIKNCVIKENSRKTAYRFLINEVNKGHQCYIICPLVSASEKTEAQSVTEYYEKLKSIFPESIRLSALHGRMDPDEKNKIMEDFAGHKSDILISTTVIEVGIDVGNATAIMIENAARFGLSQLHQLRGRVGRGDAQSYCIFMDDDKSDKENERLQVINSSNDGFFIANEDLRLRGPGELYGLRQSGEFGFRLGDICSDNDLLMLALELSKSYINDPSLMALWKESLYQESQPWNNWNNI